MILIGSNVSWVVTKAFISDLHPFSEVLMVYTWVQMVYDLYLGPNLLMIYN